MKVLTRYLVRAHIGPFIFAFVALTGVILINTLAKELANLAGKGLPMSVVLEFFVLSLPANIALTLPMAVLVSVLYTFSNLAAENEVTALRASGVDLRRAALPLVLLAAVIAGGMMWFNDRVLPASNLRWRVLMTDVAQARPLLAFREQMINPVPSADGFTQYYLEAQSIDPGSGFMRQVAIYDISDNNISRTITADSGSMAFNPQRTDLLLTLFDGDMREVNFSRAESFQTFAFEQQMMRIVGVSERMQRSVDSGYRTDRDMTVGMMRARIDTLRAELSGLRADRPIVQTEDTATGGVAAESLAPTIGATADLGVETPVEGAGTAGAVAATLAAESLAPTIGATTDPGPETLATGSDTGAAAMTAEQVEQHDRYAQARSRNIEYQIREFQVEMQKKFSIAAATLVFVLIGIPLALRFPRGGIGMVLAVSLLIFGVYYVGLIGGETLGDEGYVPPVVAMWFTNFIFGVCGLIGFLRLGHEQGTTRGGGGLALPGWLRLPTRRHEERGA